MDVELNSHSLEGPGGGGDRAGGGDTLTTAWRSHGSQKTGQRLQNTVTRSQMPPSVAIYSAITESDSLPQKPAKSNNKNRREQRRQHAVFTHIKIALHTTPARLLRNPRKRKEARFFRRGVVFRVRSAQPCPEITNFVISCHPQHALILRN